MSELNDDMWEQIELNNYGKGKLIHIVNEQAELIRVMHDQLQQAHREGWEQCQREAQEVAKQTDFPPSPKSYYTLGREDAANAIAAMEYGGKAND